MALLMVHLLAADAWAARHPEFMDCPEFYLGSISPDAIHVRDHDDKSHKNEIHLGNWKGLNERGVLDYWKERREPFDIGYGIHVLTDAQWVEAYRTNFPCLLLPNGMVDREQYYHDTMATDFELYRGSERLRGLLKTVMSARVPGDHPLLTETEFRQWREWTRDMYEKGGRERAEAVYLTVGYARGFVLSCQALMDALYARAFPEA
ncbi:MAG: hypothetical protein IJH78_04175 [Clostridia bacterium]|nr:hypothetical protein [Clostridia bacterium]